ncbi:MAG: phosphatase PAP2 family protein [Candidatus Kapaibacteriota bacterium]
METLLNIDITIFYFINKTIANPVLDKIFVLLTIQENWYIAYAILIYFMLTKYNWRGRIFLIVLVLTIITSDQLSSHLIKELVGRIRPCHSLSDIRLLVPCGGGKSFPSSHAVNNFAFAIVLGTFFKQYRTHFLTIATLIAISRVYVGVHYPSDVIAGALLGLLIGLIFAYFYNNFIQKIIEKLMVEKNESS